MIYIIVVVVILLVSAFIYMRYFTYKSPSMTTQRKVGLVEKNIFDAIDWVRGDKK